MQKDKFLILGVFVGVVGAVVCFRAMRGGDGAPGGAPGVPPLRPDAAGGFRGISLQLHNPEPDHPYEQYIDEIAEAGANTICLVVTAYQENCSSSSLFIEARKSPSPRHLARLIAYARSRPLRVMLMPIVLLENPREGEWRGKIEPASWNDWWEDYDNYILHYAKIAQQAGVETFIVGSELVSTETYIARWRELIAQVRKVYTGLLTYSANWDHYEVVKWWDDLDIIGMTTYYDLTGDKAPTVDRLIEAWKPIKTNILAWQSKIGRPILFTEVGWPNQKTCAQFPWNYYEAPDSPDPQAQANCFRAFFETWTDEPAVAGFLVWEWRNHPSQKGGPEDTSYIPCGKPAMDIISDYYRRRGPGPPTQPAPPASQPAVTVGTRPAPSPPGR